MANTLIWIIAALSIAMMLFRPFRTPEFVWTSGGAILLCLFHLISRKLAWHAVAQGTDVYLFLTGMMLLAELGKVNGVFTWLANWAVRVARGSTLRLFTMIYAVGAVVTIFMSNDATAVVLTPAVLAAVRRAKAPPMPYLLACALIANAASFVLPISNPANLVVFASEVPPLSRWLVMFTVPSLISVFTTYVLLRWRSRKELSKVCETAVSDADLSRAGKITLFGILAVALVLLVASALKLDLGLPTCLAAITVTLISVTESRANLPRIIREVSWSVLPLVASLFVIVEAVKSAGAMNLLREYFLRTLQLPHAEAALGLGTSVAVGTDLVNNLPLGLITGATMRSVAMQSDLARIVLIAIDLGPNLSITGSLATILWLISIRREGLHVSGWQFFKVGLLVMPISLILSLAAAVLI